MKSLIKGATVAIFNPEKQILLLKRSSTANWMPLKYCLPGGHAKKNEPLIKTAERELYEETDIEINLYDLKNYTSFVDNNHFVVVFVTYSKNSKVRLNEEHSKFLWCKYEDCFELDLVPNLLEIIKDLKNDDYF